MLTVEHTQGGAKVICDRGRQFCIRHYSRGDHRCYENVGDGLLEPRWRLFARATTESGVMAAVGGRA